MQNVDPGSVGVTPIRDLPTVVRRVPTQPIGDNPGIGILPGTRIPPVSPSVGNGGSGGTNDNSVISQIWNTWLSATGQTAQNYPMQSWWAKIPQSIQQQLVWDFKTGNTPTGASVADELSQYFGVSTPTPTTSPYPNGYNPNAPTPPAPSAPGNPGSTNTQDPVLQGILDALNGGGGGGGTFPPGQGLTPSGLIGSAQTTSGSNSGVVILVLVVLAVVGYYLWEKYKGKLKKHEEKPA